jgi:hypothetical protein
MIRNYAQAGIFLCVRSVILAILIFGGNHLYAQIKILRVAPGSTDPAIETVHGPHLAVYDSGVPSRHRLFFFIDGTGAQATNSLAVAGAFAKWGCHAVSIDYENNILAAGYVHSKDATSFDRYRQAIVTGEGTPADNKVKVDVANSILNRFKKLLVYLAAKDPQGGWNEFVKNGEPVWSRIIVAGHSQGSGHAAYIGKMFNVDRVIMFSGPQDYLADLHEPAPWQTGAGATPPARFFAFLSKNDPFNVQHQIANCAALMRQPNPPTLAVKPGEVIPGDYQIFINDVPAKRAHGSTLSPQFTNVWEHIIMANVKSNSVTPRVPEPTSKPQLLLSYRQSGNGKNFTSGIFLFRTPRDPSATDAYIFPSSNRMIRITTTRPRPPLG